MIESLVSSSIKWIDVVALNVLNKEIEKRPCIADSTMKAEYVAASKATNEVIWLWKFLTRLRVVPLIASPLVLFCNNDEVIIQSKELRNHQKEKHIKRKYHLINAWDIKRRRGCGDCFYRELGRSLHEDFVH